MGLLVAIIGLPQSGKTSLFNALTRAGAPVSGYQTTTVQANTAIVPVPDERVDRLTEIFHPRKKTFTTAEFVDVAGLASAKDNDTREGLSAEFIGHIRTADALVRVVRCFENPTVAGTVDAARDVAELATTLTLTDLATIEKRHERTVKVARSGDKKSGPELELLARVQAALETGAPASSLEFTPPDRAIIDDLFLLTMKPHLYVANVSESLLGEAGDMLVTIAAMSPDAATKFAATQQGERRAVAEIGARARREGTEAIAVSAKLEAELQELAPEDAAEYLEALGLPALGADRVVQAGYRLLNLITFLTAGEDEVRAWTVRAGSKAPTAAGKVHTDIERGFIRAEVVRYEDLVAGAALPPCAKKASCAWKGGTTSSRMATWRTFASTSANERRSRLPFRRRRAVLPVSVVQL